MATTWVVGSSATAFIFGRGRISTIRFRRLLGSNEAFTRLEIFGSPRPLTITRNWCLPGGTSNLVWLDWLPGERLGWVSGEPLRQKTFPSISSATFKDGGIWPRSRLRWVFMLGSWEVSSACAPPAPPCCGGVLLLGAEGAMGGTTALSGGLC